MTDTARVVEFDVAGDTYCVDITHVDQVVRPGDITDAPDLSESAAGVMTYRDTAVEVCDGGLLLSSEDAALVERRRKLDARIAGHFEEIERKIERLVEKGDLPESDATELVDSLGSLREDVVTGHTDVESVLDEYDVVVLSQRHNHEERRVGWLVDEVRDVRLVSRDDLDDTVGGEGVYGVLREATEEDTDGEEDEEEVTIWLNPDTLVEDL